MLIRFTCINQQNAKKVTSVHAHITRFLNMHTIKLDQKTYIGRFGCQNNRYGRCWIKNKARGFGCQKTDAAGVAEKIKPENQAKKIIADK